MQEVGIRHEPNAAPFDNACCVSNPLQRAMFAGLLGFIGGDAERQAHGRVVGMMDKSRRAIARKVQMLRWGPGGWFAHRC